MSIKYPTISLRFPDGAEPVYRKVAKQQGFVLANGREANLSAWIRYLMTKDAIQTLGDIGYGKAIDEAAEPSPKHSPALRSTGTKPVKAKSKTTPKVVRKPKLDA